MRKVLLGTAVAAFAVTGFALSSPASAAPKDEPGSVGTFHAPCGTAGPNLQNSVNANAPKDGAANQRSGSSTSCGIPGVLQPSDDARYYCWTWGNDGKSWTYLRNERTGVKGWVRDELLDNNGSNRNCGF